ncbi:hypothetical protein HK105_203645 [Polyrhizophydium stewartii]|uniref:Uncharacterized protein n=1 Tax=Polyrhizophydium stewartii TaxID=2732419 RepID=A0ABR4NBI5_9FUNG
MAFVVVKFGANDEKLVNPNCLCAVLLNYVKKSCGFNELPENVDLASESGEVMDLVSKPREYARKFLEPRNSYILVKVLGDDSDDSSPTYLPLLDQVGEKIKFAVTNPTFRMRTKGKASVKSEPPKVEKVEDPQQALLAKANKTVQPAKPVKNDKPELKAPDKPGATPSAAPAQAEETPVPKRAAAFGTPFATPAPAADKRAGPGIGSSVKASPTAAGLPPMGAGVSLKIKK